MPQPFTIRDWDFTNPVATFDGFGNLRLTGLLYEDGTPSQDGTVVVGGSAALPVAGGTLTGALAPAVAALTDGPVIALNASLGNVFTVTLGGNRTLATPASPLNGQHILVLVTQDGAGGRLLGYGAGYDFGTAGTPVLSTAPNATDVLGFVYRAATARWLCVGAALGF